ncbi:phage holin [Eubacterium maltosivorans]|uniref:Phage holin n=1 Tax=Eubacterium maltosivorans TaxID=2041044 RepID=A0A4P9C6G7_EUBML|nr:phage holin [Eubacterium maltosivorans]QCT71069.1 phage holin [Eubacterium maltosivorans]
MDKINWKVRLQSKEFWMAVIAFIILVAQYVCKWLGLEFDIPGLNEILSAILGLFVLLGIVVDPTTPKTTDSQVSQEKRSIDESAKEVIARTLSNDDLAEILSRVTTKEDK